MRRVPVELTDVSEGDEPVGVYALGGTSALVSSTLPLLPSLVAEKFGPGAAPEGLRVAAPNRETLYATRVGDDTPDHLLLAVAAMHGSPDGTTGFPSLHLATEHAVDPVALVEDDVSG